MVLSPLNRSHKIEIRRDEEGAFRWLRRAGNSQVISVSGQGYKVKKNMWHGLKLSNADYESVRIVDLTEIHHEVGESPSS